MYPGTQLGEMRETKNENYYENAARARARYEKIDFAGPGGPSKQRGWGMSRHPNKTVDLHLTHTRRSGGTEKDVSPSRKRRKIFKNS